MLDAYLDRIGLRGPLKPDASTLVAVHRAQAATIPYEGLDIQLRVPLDLDPQRIFDKLVTRRRGGWCYETNGLLGWALAEIGFPVMRCVAGVRRKEQGDDALGNHLMLLVTLPEPWICDLGLGDGLRAPIPLREGTHQDSALTFRLERLPDGYWRFHNHAMGTPPSFDFRAEPADEAILARKNATLQSDPDSHFVLNAEVCRMTKEGSVTLLGRTLRRVGPDGLDKRMIDNPDQMAAILRVEFGITGVDCHAMWPAIAARHEVLFGGTSPP